MERTFIDMFIKGIPKAQPRARGFYNKHVGGVRMYNPKTADSWKNVVMSAIRFSKGSFPSELPTGPIELNMCFHLPRPKSHFRTGKFANLLKDSAPKDMTSVPDMDNLVKSVMDAITRTQIVWKDDSQVCVQKLNKMYVDNHGYTGMKLDIIYL